MPSRLWTRTILAIGAAASIATTVAPIDWNSVVEEMIGSEFFDATRTKAVYAIHSEIDGPGPYKDLHGTLTASLVVRSTNGLYYEPHVRITLTSLTNPDEPEIQDVMLTGPLDTWIDVTAWRHCALPPCAEDFELTVETLSWTNIAAPLELSGSIEIASSGDDNSLELSTTSTLTVTPVQ